MSYVPFGDAWYSPPSPTPQVHTCTLHPQMANNQQIDANNPPCTVTKTQIPPVVKVDVDAGQVPADVLHPSYYQYYDAFDQFNVKPKAMFMKRFNAGHMEDNPTGDEEPARIPGEAEPTHPMGQANPKAETGKAEPNPTESKDVKAIQAPKLD